MTKISENFTANEVPQRVALALLDTHELDASTAELTELVKTLGANVVLVFTQKRNTPDYDTYFGSGKIVEIADYIKTTEIDALVIDAQLSPTQHRNIQDQIDCVVLDRTQLILEIFANHAITAEGKIQVELANLKYQLPRLHSIKGQLSRQGAGVLARGPGETKLETDRRYIKDRIEKLKSDLKELEKQRSMARSSREKSEIPLIALVGYTNVGKSTLFNLLTESNVLVENKLFATLDTTVRKCALPNGMEVLFSDTVGFIQNLPHDLIDAFHSTLEETTFADIILNVVDISNSESNEHTKVTYELLNQLGVTAPIIDVYNKIDMVKDNLINIALTSSSNSIKISALNNTGIDELKQRIIDILLSKYTKLSLILPFANMNELNRITNIATDLSIDYIDEGVKLDGYFDNRFLGSINKYIV